jgi:hypothetical protein
MCAVLVHNYCKLNAEYKKVTRELKDAQADNKEPITDEDIKKMVDDGKFDRTYLVRADVLKSQKAMEEKDVIGNVWLPKTKGDTHNDKN